ncbi:MAG: hypothetical protein HYX46_01060 [Betaproteobacteria bacterium]|nr:hypothetical protein [Betaproteobacteria bacterium]
MRANGRGIAAVDQRIAYPCELRVGDTVAITLLVGVHMDTVARKSCGLPQAVAQPVREHIVDYKLPWQ